jgi:hypothetical protein
MYDKASQTNDNALRLQGAQEIKKAMEDPYPYNLQSGKELLPLYDAYIVLQDAQGLAKWTEKLKDFPVADADTYAQLALKMNIVQLGDLRDKILQFGEQTAPGTKAAYDKLVNPTAPAAAPADVPALGPGTQTLSAPAANGGSGAKK